MKKTTFNLNAVGKIFMWLILGPQLLALVAELLLIIVSAQSGLTIQDVLGIPAVSIAFAMLAQVVFLIIVVVLFKKYDMKKAVNLRFNLGLKNTILAVTIGIIGILSMSSLISYFDTFLVSIGFQLSAISIPLSNPWLFILAIVFMAFVPAVLEELLFRGAILHGLKKYGKWIAIFGTTALFVLLHGSLQQVIYPFVLSVVMCIAVLKTDNILTSCIIHFVSNATSLCFSYFGFGTIWAGLPLYVAITLAVVGILVMLALCRLFKTTSKPKTAEEVLEMMPEHAESLVRDNGHILRMAVGLAIIFYIASIWLSFAPAV